MSDEIKPNVAEAPTHDAQLAAENIASGEEKAPKVDFDADYEAAQQLSVSEIDRTAEGAKAAQEATAPKFEMPQAEETTFKAEATGNPDDYLEMANDISGSPNEAVSNVSDDLLQKAFEMGQPGK
ncbi:MAG: hypothetical protein KME60_18570 [Cyanomargarita calcarea GSE-NOS-MK-12-04C]|jgi:hypothetical protein|uniref:Uncharacterized protein n=1 Tax=Cyanomargarita calcarea GSE-NOS-MK-12-04C TaxID=2839659 RepID=A0A951QNT2_9CYAN|nr:hypothetical protein [Cyanomargarita calcarea GSE-NOS-MK-12-04C]